MIADIDNLHTTAAPWPRKVPSQEAIPFAPQVRAICECTLDQEPQVHDNEIQYFRSILKFPVNK